MSRDHRRSSDPVTSPCKLSRPRSPPSVISPGPCRALVLPGDEAVGRPQLSHGVQRGLQGRRGDPPNGKHHCRRAWTETGTGHISGVFAELVPIVGILTCPVVLGEEADLLANQASLLTSLLQIKLLLRVRNVRGKSDFGNIVLSSSVKLVSKRVLNSSI